MIVIGLRNTHLIFKTSIGVTKKAWDDTQGFVKSINGREFQNANQFIDYITRKIHNTDHAHESRNNHTDNGGFTVNKRLHKYIQDCIWLVSKLTSWNGEAWDFTNKGNIRIGDRLVAKKERGKYIDVDLPIQSTTKGGD